MLHYKKVMDDLVDAHWEYIGKLLEVHHLDDVMKQNVEFCYRDGFTWGFEQGMKHTKMDNLANDSWEIAITLIERCSGVINYDYKRVLEFHFKTAFIHGFKHAVEYAKMTPHQDEK